MNEFGNIMIITAAALEKYLLFNDWTRDYDFKNKNMMVFERNNEKLALPSSEKLSDFYTSIPSTINILAELEDKSAREIIKEITSSYHDRIEFRIKSKFAESGELPLGYASSCIEGLKELVTYSACAEHNKEPVCIKTTNNAKHILNNFKLGQTEVGSFIINIDIKVVDDVNEQIMLDETDNGGDIEHKIVKRIGRALSQIDGVVTQKSNLDEILPTAYEDGITANMCEALLKLKPENGDINIDTTLRYASSISKKTDDIEQISLKSNHFLVMKEISERYRIVDDCENRGIKGDIISLKKKRIDAVHFYREISIVSNVDGVYRTVKSELGEEDYRVACDAHRDEHQVEINGTIDMGKKIWVFTNVEEFKII